ncbi:MAG: tyrosine-type recombinase/integrase [Coriobacteriales bacterium]
MVLNVQEYDAGLQPALINQSTFLTEPNPALGLSAPDGGGGGILAAQDLHAEALIERFLAEADIAASTKGSYRRALRLFFRWHGERGGGGVSRADILAFKNDQLSRVKSNTAGTYLVSVRSFFKWADSVGLHSNVTSGVKGTKRVRGHRRDALTPAQVSRVLSVLKGDTLQAKRDYAIFNLLARTGLRTVELFRARIIDLRNQGGQTVLLVMGKGRQERDDLVVITPATEGPLRDYLAMRRAAGVDACLPESPLFASLSNKTCGQPLSTRSLREIVKGAMRKAGIDDPRISAHSLRHTAITLALLGGASITQAQALARHTDVNVTLGYSHALDRMANAPEHLVDRMLDE